MSKDTCRRSVGTRPVALRDVAEMRAVVNELPAGFGSEPDGYRYDVLFLLPPLDAGAVLGALTLLPALACYLVKSEPEATEQAAVPGTA